MDASKLKETRRRTNKEIEELFETLSIVQLVKKPRVRWLGHTAKIAEDRWTKRILLGGEEQKRQIGRPSINGHKKS